MEQKKEDETVIETVEEAFNYILNTSGIAMVPFYAFGASASLPWFRLSIGTTRNEDIAIIEDRLRRALAKLTFS